MRDVNATVIVDLGLQEEEILKKLDKDARWGINKAIKEGLKVEEGKEEEWKEFYDIYKKTVTEGGTNPEFLENLKENTKVFFVCKYKDKIIAGAGIWFVDEYDINTPRLYFNASLREHQNLQPNNLLYWNCILWCKNNGYKKFD